MVADRTALASAVQERRRRRGLSQSDLAEAAGLSTKTIQRLEAGKAIRPGSRRAVLQVLEIDAADLESPAPRSSPPSPHGWARVDDAGRLLRSLMAALAIDVEIDREAWRHARKRRPWYRQKIVVATEDPVDRILELVDRAGELSRLPPGRKARAQDDLAGALSAAEALGWGLSSRVDERGRLSLRIGATPDPGERARQTAR